MDGRSKWIGRIAALGFALAAWPAAHAQPVTKFVVGGPPGGLFDVALRAVMPELERALGGSVVIEYKPGAGGAVALEFLRSAKPDATTVGMINVSAAANESIIRNKAYELMDDFEPVGLYLYPTNVLIANPGIPGDGVKGLVATLKARGSANYASGGVGSPGQLSGEMFKAQTGMPVTHVPYKGAPPAVLAVMTGEVAFMFATASSAIGQITGGKVRALAVTTDERLAQLPDVPTMAEAGYPEMKVSDWAGFVVPKGTPLEARDRLNAAIKTAFTDPAAQERLRKATFVPARKPLGPDEFGAFLKSEIDKWAKVVRDANITQ